MPNVSMPPSQVGDLGVYMTPPLALPQTGVKTIFSLVANGFPGGGGMLRILDIFGKITTVIGAVANATKLKGLIQLPAGTDLTAVDFCATLDINAKPAGGSLSITGTVANAMTENDNGIQIAQATSIHMVISSTGQIQVDCAGSDGGTGRVQWFLLAQASYGLQVNPAQS